MNAIQENKLSMYYVVKSTCEKYQSTWADNAVFANSYYQWVAKIPPIEQNRDAQTLATTGIATDKTGKRDLMNDKTLFIGHRLQSYANVINNAELLESVQYSASDLKKARATDAIGICNTILAKAVANADNMVAYGVTAETIADLKATIEAFAATLPNPLVAKAQTKTATENLLTLFKESDDLLTKRLDLDIELFKTSKPEFYSQYNTARIVISTGGGATSVLGNVTMAGTGEPVKGVEFTFNADNGLAATTQPIVKKSAEKGNFRIASLPEGIYTVIIKKIGFKEQVLTTTVTNGETTNLKVELERI